MLTTRGRMEQRDREEAEYRSTQKQLDMGVFAPSYLNTERNQLFKSVYQKLNMEKLRVIKRPDYYNLLHFSNNRNYIFYSPPQPSLEAQILSSGARVFPNADRHQVPLRHQTLEVDQLPHVGALDELKRSENLNQLTLNTSSKFGFAHEEMSEQLAEPQVQTPLKKGTLAYLGSQANTRSELIKNTNSQFSKSFVLASRHNLAKQTSRNTLAQNSLDSVGRSSCERTERKSRRS
mmetsp:Transcript_10126/g.17095  ORF Transcript_10126/g.17095 Transcript_10126/m.17095 type:complete len:234 (-) Transcript_10126:669-1370(-)